MVLEHYGSVAQGRFHRGRDCLNQPGRIELGFAKLIGAPAEFFKYQF